MAISNFYLPTGLTVSGSTSLTGSLRVSENVIAQSFTGSFSGSEAFITDISASTISAEAVLLPEDIIILADLIGTNELIVYSGSVFNTVLANEISSSNLYIENPFLMIADTIQTTDLEVLSVLNVSGALNLHTDYIYNIVSGAVENNFIDIPQAISILDSSISNGSKKIKLTGSLDNDGFTKINLTNTASAFNTASLDYIALNTSIKDGDRWVYSGISVEMYNSGSSVYVEISANANGMYRLLASNES
jgi:hypothetical protein